MKKIAIFLFLLPFSVYADPVNWSGFSVGVSTGISSSSYNLKPIDNSESVSANVADCGYSGISGCTTWHQKPESAIFGLDALYDIQKDDYVYGLGLRYLNLTDATATDLSDQGVLDDYFNTKIEKNYQLTARFGKVLGDNLIYLKGGVSFADLKFDVLDTNNNPGGGNRYGSRWLHGGLIGFGLDHKFYDHFIVGAEFNHISYSSENISATGVGTGTSVGQALKEVYSPKRFNSENVIFNLRYLF